MSFDVAKIQTALEGLVGIREPDNPAYQKLDASFQASSSSLFLDDVQYYKTEYWIDTQDYKDISDAALSTRMGYIRDGSVANVVNQVFREPSYIDRNKLFTQTLDRDNAVNQQGDAQTFYGYEIIPSPRKNLAFKITKVTLEFIGTGDITIQLYNSSKEEPLESIVVSVGSGSSLEEVELNWVVDSTRVPYKGTYFIGYFRNGLVEPIERNYNAAGCMNLLKELTINPIMFQDNFNNLEAVSQESDHNGLNFDITVYDDYTDLILQNVWLFARALQLQWSMTIMLSYVSSFRSNSKERISKEMLAAIIQSIEGQSGDGRIRIVGLREMFTGEVSNLRKEVHKLKSGYFGDEDKYLTITTQT